MKAEGKPLTFKNWLRDNDIDPSNFRLVPSIEDDDFIAIIRHCPSITLLKNGR
ncbi:MAG: hypothetical protein ACFFDK_11370 [Promethearchaeota archaeon]